MRNLWNHSIHLVSVLTFLCILSQCNSPKQDPGTISINPIIEENQNTGTTDWLLENVQTDTCRITQPYEETFFCRSKPIEGYTSHTSIQAGDTLEVFVSTDPPSPFTVDIYRMGYYGGKGGRKMLSLGSFEGNVQPTPEDREKNLRECPWEKSFDLEIPQDWISGVYLGKMTAEESGLQSYIVFIVKDDRQADFIFQCSDFTWQSYNRWPEWRSSYDWYYESGGHNPWHTGVGAEVSFDRPYSFYMNWLPVGLNPLTNGSGEFLLWEFPLAFWMESLGYNVSYISNLDTHTDPDGLLRAKGFLSVGHDEYWTQQMFDNVTAARDKGLNLLFLGGNSLSGEIYLKPSTGGNPNRIFGRVERFTGEEQLMGSSSYGVGLADWVCNAPEHWVFEGTDMSKGDAITDLVGWEYHGYPLGGHPGIQVLATSSMYEVDEEEGHDYAATYYETLSGNFVFNAATCWWNMLLSTPPGFPNPLNPRGLFTDKPLDFSKNDPRVQKITQNLLDRIVNREPSQ